MNINAPCFAFIRIKLNDSINLLYNLNLIGRRTKIKNLLIFLFYWSRRRLFWFTTGFHHSKASSQNSNLKPPWSLFNCIVCSKNLIAFCEKSLSSFARKVFIFIFQQWKWCWVLGLDVTVGRGINKNISKFLKKLFDVLFNQICQARSF